MLIEDFVINAGAAKDKKRVAVCITDFDAGDPYSIILMYRQGGEPEWQRIDMRRIIVSATTNPELGYVAVSDEGDVYFLEQNEIPVEKISGMGIHSLDATGQGAATLITQSDSELIVAGQNGQVFVREGPDQWAPLTESKPSTDFEGDQHNPTALLKLPNGNMLIAGWVYPIQGDNSAAMKALRAGDIKTYTRLKREVARTQYGHLARVSEGQWQRIELPGDSNLYGIGLDPEDNKVIATGGFGAALKILQDDEIEILDVPETEKILSSVVRFGDKLLIAGETDIYVRQLGEANWQTFSSDGADFSSVFKLQAFDDTLWAIGGAAIYRYEGGSWEEITIPPELLTIEDR
jgi:hypothetical protein